MRTILIILSLLVISCGKRDLASNSLDTGVSPITSTACSATINEAVLFVKTELEDSFGERADLPENLVGASFSLGFSSIEATDTFKALILDQFKSVDEKFFGENSLGIEPVLEERSESGLTVLNALLGVQAAEIVSDKSVIKDLTKVFAENSSCEVTVKLNASWKYAMERTKLSGEVKVLQRDEKKLSLSSGRLYMTRLGPGQKGDKFAVVVEDGKFSFNNGVPAGNYKVELNEGVSPNYKLLDTNVVIKPLSELTKTFSAKFPCRWNVYIDGKVEVYKKRFIFWGKWEEKLSGHAFWNMMPVATINNCYSKVPYEDSHDDMTVFNYRYNLRTDITGFASSPSLKVYKDSDSEQFKIFLAIELRDDINFGKGKTDYLTMINSCEEDNHDAQLKGCYFQNLDGYLSAGQGFSFNISKELKKETRANFSIKFEPVY